MRLKIPSVGSQVHRLSDALARTLTSQAAIWNALEDRPQALAINQEALSIFWELAQTRPDSYESNLADALVNAAKFLGTAGRLNESAFPIGLVAPHCAVSLHPPPSLSGRPIRSSLHIRWRGLLLAGRRVFTAGTGNDTLPNTSKRICGSPGRSMYF
jgi:hypothetical protein